MLRCANQHLKYAKKYINLYDKNFNAYKIFIQICVKNTNILAHLRRGYILAHCSDTISYQSKHCSVIGTRNSDFIYSFHFTNANAFQMTKPSGINLP